MKADTYFDHRVRYTRRRQEQYFLKYYKTFDLV